MLYPRGARCLGCRDPLHTLPRSVLCAACERQLERLRVQGDICPRCMTPLDERGRCDFCHGKPVRYLRAIYAAYRYAGLARRLIWQLKFYWKDDAALPFITAMGEIVPLGEYDALTYVPLHPKREKKRGANQAQTLCRLLSPRLGMPCLSLLERTSNTRPQMEINLLGRRQNVKNAFQAVQSVEGLRILLVDDIRTSGATAQECARVLLRAGARDVSLLTATIALKKGVK